MFGTIMFLFFCIELSACCLQAVYKPLVGTAIIVLFMFLIYGFKLFIRVYREQKDQSTPAT